MIRQPPALPNLANPMDVHHLIQMANRIGDFFAAMPDRAEALAGLADHLTKFWEPRMRRGGRAEGAQWACSGPKRSTPA